MQLSFFPFLHLNKSNIQPSPFCILNVFGNKTIVEIKMKKTHNKGMVKYSVFGRMSPITET